MRYQAFHRLWRRIFFCGIVLFSAFSNAHAQQELKKVNLQLKWTHQFQFAGYYAAKLKGYYQDVGLDVDFLEASLSQITADTVTFGSADFGIAGSDIISLYARGRPLRALAAIYQHSPAILVARRDAGINQLSDLKNKRVGLEEYSASILAMLRQHGVERFDLNLQPFNFTAYDLLDGRVEAMSTYSSTEMFELNDSGLDAVVFDPFDYGIDSYSDILYTTSKFMRNNPSLVNAFVEASLKGWRYAYDHPEELIDHIVDTYHAPRSRAQLEFEAEITLPLIKPTQDSQIGHMDAHKWQRMLEVFQREGLAPPNVDLSGMIVENQSTHSIRLWLLLGLFLAFLGILWKLRRTYRSL